MPVVILRTDSIVASFRIPRQGEIPLGNLQDAAADAFGTAMAVE